MGSFTRKLVSYFVLLALLPVAAAFWGFDSLATRSETRRTDARLEGGLRATLGSFGDQLQAAQETAGRLARDPDFQLALRRHDATELRRLAHEATPLPVSVEPSLPGGPTPPFAVDRSVAVVDHGRVLGTVVVRVPLDRNVLQHARFRSGLDRQDLLVAVRDGRVVLGPQALRGRPLVEAPGRSTVLTLGRFADAAYGIARGRLSERVPVRGRDEFAQLGHAFNEMAKQLETRLVELEAERVRLRES